METKNFDVAVIGAGAGGLTVAIGLANAGKKVALIERWLIGGDCTNVGCVPSKAFIDIAKKINSGSEKLPKNKTAIRHALEITRERRGWIQDEETPEHMMEKYPFTILQGTASFVDTHHLDVDGDIIHAKKIVIATGSHGFTVPIEWLPNDKLMTNESVFEITEDIKHLVVVGGGYIGCELAEAFANCGVEVHIIQRNTRLIPREEIEASELLETYFKSKGIHIHTNTVIQKADKSHVYIQGKNGWKTQKIPYDRVLMALGRRPNISSLSLENAGVKFDTKGVVVNKYNQTNKKNIFAIGDCVSGNPQFTHWANNEGRAVVRNILVPGFKATNRNAVLPATMYTTLEVARVGETLEQSCQVCSEEDIHSVTIDFSSNDRARLTTQTDGFIKINFTRLTGKIKGATIVGPHAGELLPVITTAMENKVSAYALSRQVFAYPTRAETIKRVADSFVFATLGNIKKEILYWLKSNTLQIITFILWAIILVTFFSYKQMHNLSFEALALDFYNFIRNHPSGPAIYIIAYALRPVVLFPATFLTLMSGVLFGPWWGFVYTMIGENMSANFAYLLGRIFGKKLLKGNHGLLGDLQARLKDKSFIPILFTRLAFFPFDVVNYGAGILRANWKGFFFGTLFGIIPWALVFILAGASVENKDLMSFSDITIDTKWLFIALGIFIVSLLFAKLLKRIDAWKKA